MTTDWKGFQEMGMYKNQLALNQPKDCKGLKERRKVIKVFIFSTVKYVRIWEKVSTNMTA